MGKKLSEYFLNNILNDEQLNEYFQNLLVLYAKSLFYSTVIKFDSKLEILLRYADILSLSEFEIHQNLAQQIVILLSQIFPDNELVKVVKENVYKNVSNFASLDLLGSKNKLANIESNFLNELTFNTHKIENLIPDSSKSFFDMQKIILSSMQNSQYYSFSAPTSMGKTFVITNFIKMLLKKGSNDNFAIIVPTRALLSEIANKIINDFKDYLGVGCHKVVTTVASVSSDDKIIAILTPERLYYSLLKKPEIKFQYLFIDEAHKISSKDKRSVIYYKILDIFKEENTHIYFSSPVIPNPDVYLNLTNFYTNSNSSERAFCYSPVIQNKVSIDFRDKTFKIYNNLSNIFIDCGNLLQNIADKMDLLLQLGKNKCNLVYVSSANKAISTAIALQKLLKKKNQLNITGDQKEELENVALEIQKKIHDDYYLAKLIRQGIAYHIGALPAEIRDKIEYLLRKGCIKYCFCTSTLLEGVNVPVDNLFIFDIKKGNARMSEIDAFNLIGRAGRVTLNEYGNAFIIIEDDSTQKYFDEVLLQPLPNQKLLSSNVLKPKHKKLIVETLLEGKTNLLDENKKYQDCDFSEETYEYAAKCLNMLLLDICSKNRSYIVKDFEKSGALSPQNIIDIKSKFLDYKHDDKDLNISARQKHSLYNAVKNKTIDYPSTFDYSECVDFLNKLSDIFEWQIYEKSKLGKGNSIRYYAVMLTQWIKGNGLHEIVRQAIRYRKEHKSKIYNMEHKLIDYDDSIEHKNMVINDTMKDIEEIINYKLSMYFLRLSEAIIKCHGEQALKNDWYEYVEYGTNNKTIIALQKYGFLREEALLLTKSKPMSYIIMEDNNIKIDPQICNAVSKNLQSSIETIKINYPEIFTSCIG